MFNSLKPTLVAAAVAGSLVAGSVNAGESFGFGRTATAEEIAGWDIDVRPDGMGLPVTDKAYSYLTINKYRQSNEFIFKYKT